VVCEKAKAAGDVLPKRVPMVLLLPDVLTLKEGYFKA
jgi:hypothetical protein